MTSRAPRKRRVRPAEGARVLATGMSVTAMFGLTTAMALQSGATAVDQPELVPAAQPQPSAAQPQVVVVRRYIHLPKPPPVVIRRSADGSTTTTSSGGRTSSGSTGSSASSRRGSNQGSGVPKAKPAPQRPAPDPAPASNGTSSGSG